MVFALISDKKLSIRKLVSVNTLGFFLFGTSYVPALSFESSSASSSLTNIKYSFSDSSQGLYNQFIVTFSHGFVAQHAPNADTLLSNVESNNMVD